MSYTPIAVIDDISLHNLVVAGYASVSGATSLASTLSVTGNASFLGTLTADGTTLNSLIVTGAVNVSGNTKILGTLTADGTTLNSLVVTGTCNVSGAASLAGSLVVTGNATIGNGTGNSYLTINGGATEAGILFQASGSNKFEIYHLVGGADLVVYGFRSARQIWTFADGTSAGSSVSTMLDKLIIKAAPSQSANIQEWQSSSSAVLSRINQSGYFMTKKVAAPADGDVNTSELAIWFDNTNGAGKAMFKGKTADGTVVTGSVALA